MSDTDNIDQKKRARRRLVGAVALALLAVIVLPMILDEDPQAPARDIQVTMPDTDAAGFRSRPIGTRPDSTAEAMADSLELSAGEEVIELSTPPVVMPQTDAPVQAPPPPPAQPTPPPPPVTPTPRPAEPARPVVDEADRVKAILEGRAGPRASIGPGFMVQVGAFAEPHKADALRRELADKGFPVVVETSGGMSRVRVGPFATRVEAEQGEARLSAIGRAGVVIAR